MGCKRPVEEAKKRPPFGGLFRSKRTCYFCDDGAATAFATGVDGEEVLAVVGVGLGGAGLVSWDRFTVGVGADFGFPDPDVPVETVLTASFSGQNRIARIAMTSRMITIVGQWAFVKDQRDDACAVCGAVAAGVVCATGAVTAGVAAAVGDAAPVLGAAIGLVFAATGALGEALVATGELGNVVATGAEAGAEFAPALEMVSAIATRVLCIPFSVFCTAASCDGVSVEFDASDASNCESVAASVLSVWLNSLTWLAESPADAVADMLGAVVATGAPLVPAIDGGTVLGVPASAGGTAPASISRFASVALATCNCCWIAAICAGVSVDVVWACATPIYPPMLPIATTSAAK